MVCLPDQAHGEVGVAHRRILDADFRCCSSSSGGRRLQLRRRLGRRCIPRCCAGAGRRLVYCRGCAGACSTPARGAARPAVVVRTRLQLRSGRRRRRTHEQTGWRALEASFRSRRTDTGRLSTHPPQLRLHPNRVKRFGAALKFRCGPANPLTSIHAGWRTARAFTVIENGTIESSPASARRSARLRRPSGRPDRRPRPSGASSHRPWSRVVGTMAISGASCAHHSRRRRGQSSRKPWAIGCTVVLRWPPPCAIQHESDVTVFSLSHQVAAISLSLLRTSRRGPRGTATARAAGRANRSWCGRWRRGSGDCATAGSEGRHGEGTSRPRRPCGRRTCGQVAQSVCSRCPSQSSMRRWPVSDQKPRMVRRG